LNQEERNKIKKQVENIKNYYKPNFFFKKTKIAPVWIRNTQFPMQQLPSQTMSTGVNQNPQTQAPVLP